MLIEWLTNIIKKIWNKDNKPISNEELLNEIEYLIFTAQVNYQSYVDLCYQIPNEIINKLEKRGYHISIHQVDNYNDCKHEEMYPDNKENKNDTEKVYYKTKIYW